MCQFIRALFLISLTGLKIHLSDSVGTSKNLPSVMDELTSSNRDRQLQCAFDWKLCQKAKRDNIQANMQKFCCLRKKSSSCTTSPNPNACPSTSQAICCKARPTYMKFQITGGTCGDSKNSQEDKFECSDGSITYPASIRFVSNKSTSSVYYEGTVSKGDIVKIGNGDEVDADMDAVIGGQRLTYHSSCSQNLFIGDVFGAITLVGWTNEEGEKEDCTQSQGCREKKCSQRPYQMTFEFTGGSCADASNSQDQDKGHCIDYDSYILPARVTVTSTDLSVKYFDQLVDDGETITLKRNNNIQLAHDIIVTVKKGGTIKQSFSFNTQCEMNDVFIGDIYGSMRLVGYVNTEQGSQTGCIGLAPTAPTPVPPRIPTGPSASSITPKLCTGSICLKRAYEMTLQLNGNTCTQAVGLSNQGNKYMCIQYMPINFPACVTVTTASKGRKKKSSKTGGSTVYFQGIVDNPGDLFIIRNGGDNLGSDTTVEIKDQTCTIPKQTFTFHTSCSQNLYIGDVFGGTRVVGFTNSEQGTVMGCKDENTLFPTLSPTMSPLTISPVKIRNPTLPTPTPTSRPTLCLDSDDDIPLGKKGNGVCTDLLKPQYKYLCQWNPHKKKCPVSCNTCPGATPFPSSFPTPPPTLCLDSDEDIPLGKNGNGVCTDLLKFQYQYLCQWNPHKKKCPVSCNTCPGATPFPSSFPSAAPTPCSDKIGRLEGLTCGDLETKKYRWRCKLSPYQRFCPVTCNTCPGATPYPSSFPTIAPTPCIDKTGELNNIKCSDLSPTSRFCDDNEYKAFCPITCNACPGDTLYPSFSPTIAPTPCIDKSGKLDDIKCSDLSPMSTLCDKNEYKAFCPVTCNACPSATSYPSSSPTIAPTPCTDKSGELNNIKCSDLIPTSRLCNNNEYKAFCPVTCNACPDATPYPSSSPTIAPTPCTDKSGELDDIKCSDLSPTSRLCDDNKYKAFCPVTCNTCPGATPYPSSFPTIAPTPCIDKAGELDDIKCSDLIPTSRLCSNSEYKAFCPVTCNACPGATPFPSSSPSTYGPISQPAQIPDRQNASSSPSVPPSMAPVAECGSNGCGCGALPSACYDPYERCTNKCGDQCIMNSQYCQCRTNPRMICNQWVCPYNSGCDWCSYWCFVNNHPNYLRYCPLAPWRMTTCMHCY